MKDYLLFKTGRQWPQLASYQREWQTAGYCKICSVVFEGEEYHLIDLPAASGPVARRRNE
jgi:hypothetical protein